MTDPLFAMLPGPTGALRRALDAKLLDVPDADPVLTLIVQALADRFDSAVAGRQFRGFVMLTCELRTAYRDLIPAVVADDAFETLLREIAADDNGGAAVPGT